MRWEDDVAVCRLPVHLVNAPPTAGAYESPHAALIHNLQSLDEVGVEQEVQGGELLVGGGPSLANGVQNVRPKRLNVAGLHRDAIGGCRGGSKVVCAAKRKRSVGSAAVSTGGCENGFVHMLMFS